MKKFALIMLAAAGTVNAMAQNINPEMDYSGNGISHKKIVQPDSMLSAWCLDANVGIGALSQSITTKSALGANYLNPVSANTNISSLKFHSGVSYGFDAQVGYFFDRKKHFGVGAGLMYMYQTTDATIDKFHIEYEATDAYGNVYRQLLTANHQIKEKFGTSNFNIPVVFKYKTRIGGNVDFTADAGVLINIVEQTNYNTNASFDYEAIYQYTGAEGGIGTVYDNSPTPASNDLLLTKGQYVNTQSSANIQSYFNSLRGQGYNVGLGVTPNHHTGTVTMSGSVGLLLRPAISVYLSDMVALNFGAYYVYQTFNHNAKSNYMITDRVGGYSTVLNDVKTVADNSYGVNVGIRVFFPHKEHAEAIVIPEAPVDTTAENREAPEENEVGEVASPSPVNIDISTPSLFDVNKTVIRPSGYAILEEAARELKENPHAFLVIHGYTDITGSASYNRVLSKRRAQAVKNYLLRRGVKARNMKTIGHGAKFPAASNRTRGGRARNRRVIMKLNQDDE